MFNPCDGHIDPYSLTQAIAKGARKHGAHLVQNTEVTKLDLKENGTWDIQTSQGALNAGLVINAAGFWAKEVGRFYIYSVFMGPIIYFFDGRSSSSHKQSFFI